MIRPLVTLLVITTLSTSASPPARAAAGDVLYDAVDAIQMSGTTGVWVTGILAGQATSSRTHYHLGSGSGDTGTRCDRYALLAMSKPGKFQFGLVFEGFSLYSCKLTVRTP